MKKVFALILALTGMALAQGARYDNVALTRNTSTGDLKGAAFAAIRVCTEPAGGTATECTPLANIYSDSALTQTLSNPMTADADGNYSFYVAPGQYRINMTYGGVTTTLTQVAIVSAVNQLGQYVNLPYNITPQFDVKTPAVFNMTLTGNVTSSTIINSYIGEVVVFNICQDATGSRTFTWPTNFILPPTIASSANACTAAMFFFNGSSWYQVANGLGTGGGGSSGLLTASSSVGLPTDLTDNLRIAGGVSAPITGIFYIGNGTGKKIQFARRSGGVDTIIAEMYDDGRFNTTATGNGYFEVNSLTPSPGVSAADSVRYGGCSNTACVSENGAAPVALMKGSISGTAGKIVRFATSNSFGNGLCSDDTTNFTCPNLILGSDTWTQTTGAVMTWTCTNSTNMGGTATFCRWTTTSPIEIMAFDLWTGAIATGCTTLPVVIVENQTDTVTIMTVTVSNGTQFYHVTTGAPVAVAAGKNLQIRISTAGSGCTTFPSSPQWTVQYRMQ